MLALICMLLTCSWTNCEDQEPIHSVSALAFSKCEQTDRVTPLSVVTHTALLFPHIWVQGWNACHSVTTALLSSFFYLGSVVVVAVAHFYTALFSALGQTHCILAARDSEYVTIAFYSVWCTYSAIWHGWCQIKLLPSRRTLCVPHTTMHQFTMSLHSSHIYRVHVCLAVTCHLHCWQNDQDLLHATVVNITLCLTCLLSFPELGQW